MAKADDEGLGLLIGIGPPEKGSKSGKGAESGDDGSMAAKGVLRAIERGDAGALSRALKEHYEYCKGGSESAPALPDDDY